jgi:hypothetical protein
MLISSLLFLLLLLLLSPPPPLQSLLLNCAHSGYVTFVGCNPRFANYCHVCNWLFKKCAFLSPKAFGFPLLNPTVAPFPSLTAPICCIALTRQHPNKSWELNLRASVCYCALGLLLREKSSASDAEIELPAPSGVVPSIALLCNMCAELSEDLWVGWDQ